jgi:hypothetical protein
VFKTSLSVSIAREDTHECNATMKAAVKQSRAITDDLNLFSWTWHNV